MRLRQHLLVYLFYLAVTVVITYPLITQFATRMIGHPFGDAYEYTHHIWWIKTALQTGQNPFFMPNLVYPDGVNAPLLWSLPLQSFPAWLFAFVLPLPAAFNLSALLTLALNGWSMFFLLRYLLIKRPQPDLPAKAGFTPSALDTAITPAALLAGLVFMLYPAFQGQLGAAHVGLLTLYPAPIYLYCLLRLREPASGWRTSLAGALLFMVSLWGSVLLLIYLIAPITAVYALMLVAARDWRTLSRAAVTVLLGALFAAPFVVPLAIDTLQAPPATGVVTYSAALLGVASPSFYHPLFGALDYNRRVLGIDPFEQASYVGIVAAALALIGVWKVRQARWWLLMALVAWVFSLGPLLKIDGEPLALRLYGYATHVSLPWGLFQNLPLINIARTPARFNFAVGFAVAVMSGYGLFVLISRERTGTEKNSLRDKQVPDQQLTSANAPIKCLITLILMLAIGFEYQFWWGMPTIPGVVPEPIAALAARQDIRAVFDIPWYHPLVNKNGMFLQTAHHQPMIVGQVARRSPVNPAKVNLLQDTLDPALLDAAGVDIVILHKEYDGNESAIGAFTREKLGAPFYEDTQYAVFEVPDYEGEPPGFTTYADGGNLYFYAPEAGQATLTGQVTAHSGAAAALDDAPLVEWTAHSAQGLRVPTTFAAGYHTISIQNDPVCPAADDAALECPVIDVQELALKGYQPR